MKTTHSHFIQRNQTHSKGSLWPFLLPIVAGLLLWILFGPNGLWQLYKINAKNKEMNQLLSEKTKENNQLEKQIARLKTDPGYQEEMARKELGWIKENEIIYQFEPKAPKQSK
ncbi:MAG: septum formation initiator family protein [Deltaproteobacteria bacterium]|nr:septum formation initiator family protein [Deltaproteobacteria bacterium]